MTFQYIFPQNLINAMHMDVYVFINLFVLFYLLQQIM